MQGIGRHFPLVILGVLAAHFSLAGFPLLVGFPILLSLMDQLVQISVSLALFTLLGSFGLLIGGLRSLTVFVIGPEELPEQEKRISPIAQTYLLLGVIAIFLGGLFPDWFSAIIFEVLEVGLGQ